MIVVLAEVESSAEAVETLRSMNLKIHELGAELSLPS